MQYLSLWGWLSSFNMLLFACIHFPADGITWRPIIWEYFSGETPSLAVEPVVTLCHYAFSMLTELSRSHTADHFLYQTLPQKTNTLCPQSPLEGCSGRWGTAATARSLPGTTRKCPKQSLWAQPPTCTFLPMKILIDALGCALTPTLLAVSWQAQVLLRVALYVGHDFCYQWHVSLFIPPCQSFQCLYIIPHYKKIILGTNFRTLSPNGLLRRIPAVRG